MQTHAQKALSDSNASYSGSDELRVLERYLINYNRDLISALTKAHKNTQEVLEFGAGIGTLASLWQRSTGIKPECVEIDPQQRLLIKERGFICHDSLQSIDKKFDVIYSSNVLEHIQDDVSALRQIQSKLKRGGTLAVFVPAFQILYSGLDQKVGHYRRYAKRDLLTKLVQAGFHVNESRFYDSIGFIAWLYLKARGYHGAENEIRNIKIYDKYIFPISRLLDVLGCQRLFGKNVLVFAQKIR